nr:reverse transcriptase [Tanacetum cinerariifolium]
MNICMLPEESIKEIHRAFNCYWWGNGNNENPIRWVSWESMCTSKSRGARILKARYYPRDSFLDARIVYQPSFVWRSLCLARNIIRKGQRWNVGNSMKVRIWEDYWLEGFRTLDYRPQNCAYNVISDLLDERTDHVSKISIEDMLAMAKNRGTKNFGAHVDGYVENMVCKKLQSSWGRRGATTVLVAGNRRVAYATSVIAIETNAIFWAIQVAIAKDFRNVILETDSNILVDAFLHNKELLQIRGLFLHIRRLCCSFVSCSWSFVRREGNRVAHELARSALYDNRTLISNDMDSNTSDDDHDMEEHRSTNEDVDPNAALDDFIQQNIVKESALKDSIDGDQANVSTHVAGDNETLFSGKVKE